MNDLRDFLRNLYDRCNHTGRDIFIEVLSGLIKTLGLRRKSCNHAFDDCVYRSGKAFDIRNNTVVYCVYRFRRRQLARSAHCSSHIAFNAAHVVGEAHAHAVRHVAADFSEYP